ncbi:lamin tail domain-containing protein [Fulvivirga sedimenti]|uniref:Lamin tail domain-containing protein n=1 Tax=Fulvivirga sedimenti TaxID=2879465 RepID=A0A9X1HY27_9BACT|nr:lamin tail domain-containing protein [Fulvivirga sedimenti]MCA6078554.1 lamin tail domain-containing protein [Fulvivirga sedimenti]
MIICKSVVFAPCLMAQEARIVEIMSDPEPSRGLPAAEYVELLISEDGISTENWTLQDASGRIGRVGRRSVNAGDLIVLCSETNSEKFPDAVAVEPWPVLNNTSDRIILRDGSGDIIDSVTYFQSWHQGSDRDGGVSFEMINPRYLCIPENNWRSSVNEAGGTPGVTNSIYKEPVSDGPFITNVYAESDIYIWFDKSIVFSSLNAESIRILPEIRLRAILMEQGHYVFRTDQRLFSDVNYGLELVDIKGCDGSISKTLSTQFMVSDLPGEEDLCINEILFNAAPGNSDYIELANISAHQLTLRGVTIERFTQTAKPIQTVIDSLVSIPSNDYLVITKNRNALLNRYRSAPENKILEIKNLLNLPDRKGNLVLKGASGSVMDEINYDEGFHHQALENTEDVSLERISMFLPAITGNNWTSASQADGFGTPGRPNSQLEHADDMMISVNADIGLSGNAQIVYHDLPVGTTLSAKVFDMRGRITGDIVSEFLTGRSGMIEFNFEAVGIKKGGMYFVWIEILTQGGKSHRFIRRLITR